ncbi:MULTISPECIES: hypothetical protein [unclassified Streptomyces]|uniref:hypothetical protein n=1 Tax=unclassified Streptomyces TaxID=2593676 RepID=UPI0035D79DCB
MRSRAPLPPFPRWTGAHTVISSPRPLPFVLGDGGGELHVIVSAHVTCRALAWAWWRALTGRKVSV